MSEENKDQQTETSSQEQTQENSTENQTENSTSQEDTSQQKSTEEQSSNPISDAVKGESDPEGKSEEDDSAEDNSNDSNENSEDDQKPKEDGEDKTKDGEDEGYEITLSDDSPLSDNDLDQLAEMAEKNGWSKDEADNAVKKYEEIYSRGIEQANEPRMKYYKEQKESFEKDPSFQGDNRAKTYTRIKAAADKFGDEGLLKDLNRPEIGNNYNLAKFLSKIGEILEGDGPPIGKGGSGGGDDEHTSSLKALYPDFFKEEKSS